MTKISSGMILSSLDCLLQVLIARNGGSIINSLLVLQCLCPNLGAGRQLDSIPTVPRIHLVLRRNQIGSLSQDHLQKHHYPACRAHRLKRSACLTRWRRLRVFNLESCLRRMIHHHYQPRWDVSTLWMTRLPWAMLRRRLHLRLPDEERQGWHRTLDLVLIEFRLSRSRCHPL